ncbi:MAG: YcxB family protein [Lachnospiraceae bacterium]|nr:YcxB family protein [Lachnospiraceae bacterium]
MANIFFENRFILTRKLHKQYCKKTFRKMRKNLQIYAVVLAVIALAASLLFLFYFKMQTPAIVFGVLSLYLLFMALFGYTFSEWINYRKLQKEHGKAIAMILEFYQDKIAVRVNKASFSFKYSSLSGAYETEDLIILIIGKRGMIEHGQVVFKDGFKDGKTIEEFKAYINKKTKKELFGESLNGEV